MHKVASLLLFTAALYPQLREGESLIVPGFRVGRVKRTSTEQDLRNAFGDLAITGNIGIGEGVDEPGLIIHPSDPARRLEITWNGRQPSHPATIFICRSDDNHGCRWRTANGIGVGTSLRELQRMNGRPFEMVGWGSDVGGNLTSFRGGQLEKELIRDDGALYLTLVPRIGRNGDYLPTLTGRELSEVEGEKFLLSSHPVLQKLNPHVGALRLVFRSEVRRR